MDQVVIPPANYRRGGRGAAGAGRRGGQRGRGGAPAAGGDGRGRGRGNRRGGGGGGGDRGGRGAARGRGGAGTNGGQAAPAATADEDSDADYDFSNLDNLMSKRRRYGEKRLYPCSFKKLEELSARDEREMVLTLQENAFGFKELLQQDSLQYNMLALVLSVLRRATGCVYCPNNVIQLLNDCVRSNLFTKVVPQFLTSAPFGRQDAGSTPLPAVLADLVGLFDRLLTVFPHTAAESLGSAILACREIANVLAARGTPLDESLLTRLTQLDANRVEVLGKFDRKELDERARNEAVQVQPPPDDFRGMSIVPTLADVHEIVQPFLRPNVVGGRYADAEHYLDVHFRLMREDFVAPLRDGLNNLLSLVALGGGLKAKGRAAREINVKVYDEVRVVAMECCPRDCIINVLRFNLRSLGQVRWEATKRLLHGALVCMSSDNFRSMLLAVIVRRDANKLREGILSVRFLRETPGWAEPAASEVFTMVESPAYFEAYEPILRGLQQQDSDSLPFSRYIVEAEPVVNSPRYLHPITEYDLRPLLRAELRLTGAKTHGAAVRVGEPRAWPSAEDLGLDAAQYSALRLALTNELALVQGPPGTGKTFLGLKMVEALLYNQRAWAGAARSPILVICFTNHALDQFLEGILALYKRGSLVSDYKPHTVVRVGGQSKCEALKAVNLTELRKSLSNERNIPAYIHKNRKRQLWNLHMIENDIQEQMHLMKLAESKLLTDTLLEDHMEPRHLHSLLDGGPVRSQWTTRNRRGGRSAIAEWLGLTGDARLHGNVPVEAVEEAVVVAEEEPAAEDNDHSGEEEDVLAEEEINRRLVDDNDDFFVGIVGSRRNDDEARRLAKRRARMEEECFANGEGDDDEEESEWEVQGGQRRLQKYVSNQIRGTNSMTQAEATAVVDVWRLILPDRWRLYRLWLQKLRAQRLLAVQNLKLQYQVEQKSLLEVQRELDIHILRDAKVIGMTTTGAAKHREILQVIAPRVVVVEEAAEVLEAHVITALTQDCHHLILIGDQQQLRPNPTVYKLAKDFHLDVSLFERLIKNGVAFECLSQQHRMRPEISALLVPHIYKDLRNHPSVDGREDIRGVASNVFFLNHSHLEGSVADTTSRENPFEAKFVVALCRYLLLQGYESEQITILTTYVGQLYLIKREIRETLAKSVRCTVVDNYQGEENDIILLSLVRSNVEGFVGFLRVDNRVCVALSRARNGLYVVGNLDLLSEKSQLWRNIIEKLERDNRVGGCLTLACQNHPNTKTEVADAADFDRAPEGGCSLPCEYRLTCGHRCPKMCHNYDREHTEMKCNKACERVPEGCEFGHKCQKLCYVPCGACTVLVSRELPGCGHVNDAPCHADPRAVKCQRPCRKTLACGHKCTMTCSDVCNSAACQTLVKVEAPCGHTVTVPCRSSAITSVLLQSCRALCSKQLLCDHRCKGDCSACFQGRFHVRCGENCGRLLVCDHPCPVPCAKNCPPCQRVCENRCDHSKCPGKCGLPCKPCVEPCSWGCPHQKCTLKCHEVCNRPPCDEPCPLKVPGECGHPCIGLCGETCPPKCRICNRDEVCEVFLGNEEDENARFVLLEDCGHIFEVGNLDQWMAIDTGASEDGEGGHHREVSMKQCPRCRTVVRRNQRYGAKVKGVLNAVVNIKRRIFGDARNVKRDLAAMRKELAEDPVTPPANDQAPILPIRFAGYGQERSLAVAKRDRLLQEMEHPNFFSPCRYQLRCDVAEATQSIGVGEMATLQSKLEFLKRMEALWYDVPVERRPDFRLPRLLRQQRHIPDNPLLEQLTDLREWLKHRLPAKESSEQQLIDFSRELQRATVHLRFMRSVKFETRDIAKNGGPHFTALYGLLSGRLPFTEAAEAKVGELWELVKKHSNLPGLDVTRKEADAIVRALGLGKGRWFTCPNGHYYIIGECGGAMQTTKCPECGSQIGGSNHRVLDNNRFSNVLDGAERPLWQ